MTQFRLTVNGKVRTVNTPADRPLLEVLREDLQLTGTKYGCGEGQCRACTVLIDGKASTSCTTPVRAVAGRKITTIEGIAANGQLHRVQQAFVDEVAEVLAASGRVFRRGETIVFDADFKDSRRLIILANRTKVESCAAAHLGNLLAVGIQRPGESIQSPIPAGLVRLLLLSERVGQASMHRPQPMHRR